MSIAKLAKRALGQALRLERRTIGISRLVPFRVRHKLRLAMGMGPVGEGRRYASQGLEQFFQTLNEHKAAYVVLRWFESLPDHVDGDIDFLVADEALPEFEALLGFGKNGVPCDVYSESGRRGFRYAGMPYFPPLLARRVLSRRITSAGLISVPCPEDHFLTLAYHAVYHKGLRSGLPTTVPDLQPESAPKHDYCGTLTRLAENIQTPVEMSMEALDEFLSSQGWRPSAPILKRLARDNIWVRRYFGVNLEPRLRKRPAFKLDGDPQGGGQHAGA